MKLRITITGEVHNVGYRPFLLGIAESLEIDRFFADNIYVNGSKAVEILVEGDDDKINLFVELVKTKKPEKAVVEGVKAEEYDGNVMKIESYYRYLTALQLAKIATYGGGMLEKQDKMLEKQDTMLGKMDLMLDKQDETIKEIKKISEKQDKMLEKQDETIKEIKTISTKLDKTNELLERRFEKLEKEVEKIKMALMKAGIDI